MKKSSFYSFSCCAFIAAGSLTIFAHQSEAKIAQVSAFPTVNYRTQILTGRVELVDQLARRLSGASIRPDLYIINKDSTYFDRGLEATGDGEYASPSNLFHINLKELSSLLNCQNGCTATFALITSDQCNSTDAHDSAFKFKFEKEITFDNTDIESDEDAPDSGWVTESFRELANKSTDNSTTAPPISLAEFVIAAAMATEFIDTITPNQDYNLAVYLYNNETEPLACATLDLVTEDEELQIYYNLFCGGGDEEGEDGSEGVEGGVVGAVGNGNGSSSPFSGGLLAYAVTGVSVVLSVILFA